MLAAALVVAIAVSVTPILVVNAFRVLATGTFVRAELGRDGFPPDRYGLTDDQRKELALLGLRSIQPGSEGIALLERARLPNGSPAFGLRELTHMGLLPWPERLVGAGLVQGARSRGSRVLLGGAFAVCAAPCIGPVLAAILVLAGSSDTALEGAALLAVYSLGLAIPFVLAGALFTRAMGAFRWLRDHYRAIQFAGGLVMVVLGLLLFFGRFYVLRIYVNRALERIGLEPVF